jgi:hypothetical protein
LRRNCLLKHAIQEKIEGKIEGARRRRRRSKYWMNLRNKKDTGNLKRKH